MERKKNFNVVEYSDNDLKHEKDMCSFRVSSNRFCIDV